MISIFLSQYLLARVCAIFRLLFWVIEVFKCFERVSETFCVILYSNSQDQKFRNLCNLHPLKLLFPFLRTKQLVFIVEHQSPRWSVCLQRRMVCDNRWNHRLICISFTSRSADIPFTRLLFPPFDAPLNSICCVLSCMQLRLCDNDSLITLLCRMAASRAYQKLLKEFCKIGKFHGFDLFDFSGNVCWILFGFCAL